MEKPVLSPSFAIEDIHRLREYNYVMAKRMTDEERMDYYNKAEEQFSVKLKRQGFRRHAK